MTSVLLPVFAFAIIVLSSAQQGFHPLSDEFIESINRKNTTWKAGRNFPANTPLSDLKKRLGALPKTDATPQLPFKLHNVRQEAIPESFDSREAWPECADVIGNIRDQGACGCCWAFGAVEAMSDRICIHSKGQKKVSLSAEDVITCCTNCGYGCHGGYPSEAWNYWNKTGIVTGGKYKTNDGCQAYTIPPCDHNVDGLYGRCGPYQDTPQCTKECDSGTNLDYASDKLTGSAYNVHNKVAQIQTEIMTNGPVEAVYMVFEDFYSYKSGVYQHVEGYLQSSHAVKIIGWGVENDVPYWLIANSWNEFWGDHGFFKILRGADECLIEDQVVAGLPSLNG